MADSSTELFIAPQDAASNSRLEEYNCHARNRDVPSPTLPGNEAISSSLMLPLVIRPYPSSIYDKPCKLQPVRVINRSQLPLSFLDTAPNHSGIPGTRLCSAHIEALQTTDPAGQYRVLLARRDKDGPLCAVELVQAGIYALCSLASWVSIDMFDTENPLPRLPDIIPLKSDNKPTETRPRRIQAAIKRFREEDLSKPAKRIKLSTSEETERETAGAKNERAPANTVTEEELEEPPKDLAQPLLSADEVLENLVRQYLEALYVSKSSLAFFAKGPLSRARAAFNANETSAGTPAELAAFLRSMVMKVNAMDKKYRERLLEVVRQLPPAILSEDENPATIQKKRKRLKRPRLGKDGIYSFEEEYVKRWWRTTETDALAGSPESAESLLKRKIADLRTRETFAQIIMILEILALESSPSYQAASATSGPDDGEQQHGNGDEKKATKKPPKKPQDLGILLDLHTDKLSIWQSVEEDVFGTTGLSHAGKSTLDAKGQPADCDSLSSFCIEVVVPFYKARLPKEVATLSKRLGGPSVASPDKQPRMKQRQSAERKSIGRSTTNKATAKPRQPLKRTASTAELFPRPPSLARSVPESQMIPGLKREASEVPLSSIPFKDVRSRVSREPSVQMHHLRRRQVNLTELSAASQARLGRKRKAEEELKAAISTLKKPNRGLAVKELVEASDQRLLTSNSKNGKQPMRKPLQTMANVQIAATPKNVRRVDHITQPLGAQRENGVELQHQPSTPSVPASIIKPTLSHQLQPKPIRPLDLTRSKDTVTETPARGHKEALLRRPAGELAAAASIQSPAVARVSPMASLSSVRAPQPAASIQETPSRGSAKYSARLFATPRKTAHLENGVAATPVPAARMHHGSSIEKEKAVRTEKRIEETASIYDALGWNDDYDELAL